MSRIPLPKDRELDAVARAFLSRLPPLNIARMVARTGIAPAFYTGVSAIFDANWFPARDREIMLFRVCRANHSAYEIHQHRAYGGLPVDLVDAILSDNLAGLDPWDRELCGMCDEISEKAKLSEVQVARLVEHYGGYDMACRAILVMSWFNMLSRYVDSTGVPIEDGPNPYAGIVGPASSVS
jgi:alkylhydroperoxidase family enzyme